MGSEQTESPFAVGDIVSLKSGGHPMTITEIDGSSATCAWSIRDDCKSKSFPFSALKLGGGPQKIVVSFVGPDGEESELPKR